MNLKTLPDGRMDTANTAVYIGCKIHTLAQWRHEKKGPPYIKCGRVYYFKYEVDKWLDSKRKGK